MPLSNSRQFKKKSSLTRVIKTDSGNFVAMINGKETFISADGNRANVVLTPCFKYLTTKKRITWLETELTDPFLIAHFMRSQTKKKRPRLVK